MKKIENRKLKIGNAPAFTLIELLVVISIIAILAAFTVPALYAFKRNAVIKQTTAELEQIATAIDSFKAAYGFYPPSNQNNNSVYLPSNKDRSQFSQLYYELIGTTLNGSKYVTLDGASQIATSDVLAAYGVGGFINQMKSGAGEDAPVARSFLSGLKSKQISSVSNNSVPDTIEIVASVGGPDPNYEPVGVAGMNPFRYVSPGVNNPNSFDLWVQLVIGGKTNLICNWSKQVQFNSPLP